MASLFFIGIVSIQTIKFGVVVNFQKILLRHTFASRMAMAGVDLVTLAALLGHSRMEMDIRYAHPVEEHKIEAIQKLENYNNRKLKVA